MPTTETFTYTLPSGATIEVQNLPSDVCGAREAAAAEDEDRPPLAKILAPLGEVVQLVLDQIRSSVQWFGQFSGRDSLNDAVITKGFILGAIFP